MKTTSTTLGYFVLAILALFAAQDVSAAGTNWQKCISIHPDSSTSFSTTDFRQSVRNAQSVGANCITLIYQVYQTNLYTTDVAPGWNTPSDAALVSATNFIHGLGMDVTYKAHVDSYTNEWRAFINPGDRDTWFRNYGNVLFHLADIASANGVEQIVIGTELTSMSRQSVNFTNTQNWRNLITGVRARYSGLLTYSAQHGFPYPNEAYDIAFWDQLDYIGLSAYFSLCQQDYVASVECLRGSWAAIERDFIAPLRAQKGNMEVVFTEIGYASYTGSHQDPPAWWRSGPYDEGEQARDFEALQYFDTADYMKGVHIWDWEENPNAGGPGNTGYTPQNKPQSLAALTALFAGRGGDIPPPPTVSCSSAPGSSTFNSCYYDNANFTNPVLSRSDDTLNFEWGGGSPHSSIAADTFSVKSYGNFTFENGEYEFTVTSDDGVRVSLDNTPIIDQMIDQPATTYTATRTMAAGSHTLKVEYFESFGGAVLQFSWRKIGGSTPPPPSGSCPPDGGTNAFVNCFFNERDFTSFVLSRTDTSINFDWAGGSPDPAVDADTFSMISKGNFAFENGDYEFVVTADDGVRVSIDGTPIIDQMIDQPPTTYRATRTMNAGTHTVRVDYFESYGGASVQLNWVRAGSTPPPPPPNPDLSLSIWWPTDGSTISGLQPFKARIDQLTNDQYRMYWQVNGHTLNEMTDVGGDYPHKVSEVDVSGWPGWGGNGPFTLNFVAKDPTAASVLKEKSVQVFVQ